MAELKANVLEDLGYFLKPSELFSALAERGKTAGEDESTFILDDLTQVLANIEKSTTSSNSEDDFDGLFYQLDLNDKTRRQRQRSE